MNKCFLTTAVLSTAIACSAYAGTDMKGMAAAPATSPSDAGLYVAAYGGANFAQDYGNSRQVISDGGTNYTSNSPIHDSVGDAEGVKVGYNFESFAICDTMSLRLQPAVEAEALYLGTTATGTFNGPTIGTGTFTEVQGGIARPAAGIAPGALATNATIHDTFHSAAWFLNGILRFKNSSIVTPYIGAGPGGEYITMVGHASTDIPGYPHVSGLNRSDVDFAVQALAGLDFAIVDHFSIFTEYKFIDAFGTDAKAANVGNSGLDYRFKPDQIQQHLIVAGLKYSF